MMRKILNFCRRKKIPLLCLGITIVILVVLETNLTNIIIDTRTIMRTKHQQKVEMVDKHSLKQASEALKLVLPDLNQHYDKHSTNHNPASNHRDKQPTNHNPASNHPDKQPTNHNPASKIITLKESNQRGISPVSARCLPTVDPSGIKTTFKFYIYELPPYFNLDIQNKMTKDLSYCYNLDFCGTGEELYQLSKKHSNQGKKLLDILKGRELQESTGNFDQHHHKISIRNSHQFALEVIMHYKLLHSQYRTLDPNKADFFYIPAYTGLQCLSASASELGNTELIVNLFNFLATNRSTYYKSGKPHFSTLSKIHREQASRTCTTLRHPDSENITYIAIEKESNPDWLKMPQIQGKSIIVAPYPSYVHFTNTRYDKPLLENNDHVGTRDLLKTNFRLNMPNLKRRNVFLFLAAGTRRSNPFRAKILDQFLNKTDKSYDDYFSNIGNKTAHFAQATDVSKKYPNLQQLMLITIECSSNHRNATIPWMARSIFCLQPPGDSPTRKSFYDSILSGCIPVIFTERFKTQYPFERWLNYSDFTVTIDAKLVSRYDKRIIDVLREISMEKMRLLHENVLKVAKWFQYSIPDGGVQVDDDAVTLILKDLKAMHNM